MDNRDAAECRNRQEKREREGEMKREGSDIETPLLFSSLPLLSLLNKATSRLFILYDCLFLSFHCQVNREINRKRQILLTSISHTLSLFLCTVYGNDPLLQWKGMTQESCMQQCSNLKMDFAGVRLYDRRLRLSDRSLHTLPLSLSPSHTYTHTPSHHHTHTHCDSV